jgi:hypothetical protein
MEDEARKAARRANVLKFFPTAEGKDFAKRVWAMLDADEAARSPPPPKKPPPERKE